MNNQVMDKVVWREINNCNQPRTYAACLKWNDFVPPFTVIPAGLPAPFAVQTCQDVVAQQIAASIQTQQQQWVAERLTSYRARYAVTCAAPEALSDHLNLSYKLGYHHFTLYYYDRGGNLMKTVPPAGVRPLDLKATTIPDYPIHELETNYRYNSLGQLVKQTTPDGGTTDFFYNRKGQLRYSLNDKQRAAGKYSYTAYDALGRVEQVGESTSNYSPTLAQPLLDIEAVPVPPASTTTSVTRTVYNLPLLNLTYLNGPDAGQRYLNNRVSYTLTSDGARTSYSYDPHGNVEWLAQDVPGLDRKFVRYAYDLLSNKVLQVDYQAGQPDQFFHRYRYDDDNRLLAVQTSADGQVWEQDAAYSYYAHGPLKRTVLGDDQVQALDYAYTLQGWLKAVNHPNLTTASPLTQAAGKDGHSNGVAADAFGMVLGYYRGDYAHAGTYLDAGTGTALAKVLREPTAGQELFNGNIATWSSRSLETTSVTPTQTTPPAAETYQYDQLNRLLSGQRSTYNANNLTWSTATADAAYSTRYSYDANGNLQTLGRNTGTGGQLLDDLTYHYDPAHANRLQWVTDPVPSDRSDEDVDTQAPNNYGYDEVGNLTSDTQAGVGNIAWTPYGKIARVSTMRSPKYPYTAYVYDAQGNRISKTAGELGVPVATTYYVRDAQGNPLAVYERQTPAGQPPVLRLREQALYGSARLGLRQANLPIVPGQALPAATGYYARVLGQKRYELSDHLGNVRAVVTDQKASALSASTGQPLLSSLQPVLSAYYNYYPFGQLQPGAYGPGNTTAGGGYRYGYNGKEKDNNGELGLTTYDYGFRIY